MKIKQAMSCATLLSSMMLSMTAAAQIYETTDEQGNTVFSDMPAPGAEQVDLQQTNTAEAPEVRPPSAEAPKAKRAPSEAAVSGDDEQPAIIGGNDDYDDLIERREAQERREEVRERVGEGDNPQVTPHPARPHVRPQGGRR